MWLTVPVADIKELETDCYITFIWAPGYNRQVPVPYSVCCMYTLHGWTIQVRLAHFFGDTSDHSERTACLCNLVPKTGHFL